MAKRSRTVTILGGGSFYTPSFIGTMCRRGEVFAGAEVRLCDPNAERVALVSAFCRKFTEAKGVPITFTSEPDLDRALDGTDFVLVTFRVGGASALMLDETIPPRFGYYGNETVGPGGMFMAMRTIPVLLDIADRMARLCPKAWLLNYANPTNFIADALCRRGYRRSVGLCDGFICPPRDIGVTVGVDFNQIDTRHAGVNHCSWVYRATAGGRDLLEEMRRLDDAALDKDLAGLTPEGALRRRRWLDIFRLMGLYPAPAGHLEPYFYHDEFVRDQQKRAGEHHTYREDHDRKNWDSLKAVLNDFNLTQAEPIARTHFGGHADLAVGVMAALATGSGEVFPVNIPHRGAVPGMPKDAVLEMYCQTTRTGFKPEAIPPFPPAVIAQQSHVVAFQQLAVAGILEKDRRTLLQALSIHPFTTSAARAKACFDAMWNEEKHTLGEYWTD